MSDVLTGDLTHVTAPLSATVSALTNNGSGAIRVLTAAPHLYGTGDLVVMDAGAVQGPFQITVIDSDHFDLNGSTYTASYSGIVKDISLTPQILVPTDGDTFSAQLSGLTSAFQGLLDRTQYLQAASYVALQALGVPSASDASTWSVPVVADPSTTYLQNPGFGGPEWDTVNGQWMLPTVAGSSDAQLYVSYDGWDEVWLAVGSPSPFAIGGTPNSITAAKGPSDTDTFYLAVTYPTSSFGLQIGQTLAGGAWTVAYADPANGYLECQSANFASYILFASGGTTAGVTNIITSNDKLVTTVVNNVGATVGAVNHWICRSNGTIWIAAPAQQTFATPFLYTSIDGHTLVHQTAGFGGNLLSTDAIVGLDYGMIGGVGYWVMAVRTVGGDGKLLRSTDGINWTPGVTLTELADINTIAAVGNLWVAVLKQTAPARPLIVYSTDTVNWYLTPARMLQFVAHVTQVRSSGYEFCVSNRYGARFSQVLKPLLGPLT